MVDNAGDRGRDHALDQQLWWLRVGGTVLGCGGVLLGLVLIASLGIVAIFLGINSSTYGPHPPPPVPATVRTVAWLPLISTQAARMDLPNTLVAAVVAASSHGEALRSRGAQRGLLALNAQRWPHAPLMNPATNLSRGVPVLGQALGVAGGEWQTGLAVFHTTAQGGTYGLAWARSVRATLASFDGPVMGAWAVAAWHHGHYTDPGQVPEWVIVAAAAPTGRTLTVSWRPPTVEQVTETVTKPQTGKTHTMTVTDVIRHTLTVTDLGEPLQVWGTLKTGRTVAFQPSGPQSSVPAYPGQFLWGAQVPLTGPDALVSVTARWSTGVLMTIHWSHGAMVRTTTWHLITNAQAIRRWWPAIQAAAQATGVPADLIGAVMLHESGGNPDAVNPFGPAYGLMQILNTTAPGLPGYAPGWEFNGPLNLLLGAELLHEDYQQTGGTSWHAAIAAYYGGLGRMERDGFVPGMPWSEAAPVLNVIPAAWAGNTETMTAYADQMMAEEAVVAREAPSPPARHPH